LGSKVVYLIGVDLAEEVVQGTGVIQISVDETQLRLVDVGIGIDMVDALRVERTGSPDDPVDRIPFLQQ